MSRARRHAEESVYRLLAGSDEPLRTGAVASGIGHLGHAPTLQTLRALEVRGLVKREAAAVGGTAWSVVDPAQPVEEILARLRDGRA